MLTRLHSTLKSQADQIAQLKAENGKLADGKYLRLPHQHAKFLHKPTRANKMLLWMAAFVQEAVYARF